MSDLLPCSLQKSDGSESQFSQSKSLFSYFTDKKVKTGDSLENQRANYQPCLLPSRFTCFGWRVKLHGLAARLPASIILKTKLNVITLSLQYIFKTGIKYFFVVNY